MLVGQTQSQIVAKTDTVYVRDTVLGHAISITKNDTLPLRYEISSFIQSAGTPVISSIVDSNVVTLVDTGIMPAQFDFDYTIRDKVTNQTSSSKVVVIREKMLSNIYLGDINNDGIVNNLDILPIGLKYKAYGSPRHQIDRSIVFRSVSAGNWKTSTRNLNDKYIDVDGNGFIDSNDVKPLSTLLLATWKAPSSVYSAPSVSTTLTGRLDSNSVADTFQYFGGPINLPVRIIQSQPLPNSYGLAYSFDIKVLDKVTSQDVTYPVQNNIAFKNFNLWNEKPLLLYERRGTDYMVGAVKTDGSNSPTDGYAGVIEIVVDVIIAGLRNSGDVGRFTVNFKEAVWITNDGNTLDVTPKPYIFYVKNKIGTGSIQAVKNEVKIYPNPSTDQIQIVKSVPQKVNITIQSISGQRWVSYELSKLETSIDIKSWPAGIYLLNYEGQITKIVKQ